MFEPRFQITSRIAKALMAIEADRQVIAALPLSVPVLESLRRSARLLSTLLSTQIEGNRLTQAQVRMVVEGEGNFPGRERDELEVRHYFAALEHVEQLGRTCRRLTEKEIRTIHGLVMSGKVRPTPYRDGQNVIRDARSGRIVYLPPEAKDVPSLMKQLVKWTNQSLHEAESPVPIIAAIVHYQFATIHPYYDGNGRTARLLTNLVLHRAGYGLKGIFSLEEYYAENLAGYYDALSLGASHNYYFGRAEAEITPFVEYFTLGMADAFARVRARAEQPGQKGLRDQSPLLRELSAQQRRALGLFVRSQTITAKDVARFFKMKPRQASLLCAKWAKDGFLVVDNPSTKARSYRLVERYEEMV